MNFVDPKAKKKTSGGNKTKPKKNNCQKELESLTEQYCDGTVFVTTGGEVARGFADTIDNADIDPEFM